MAIESRSQLPTTVDGGNRPRGQVVVDGFVLDRKDKVSVLIRKQEKSSSRRHLVDGI